MMRRLAILLAIALAFIACREEQISDDPQLQLTFSKDTVAFDTIFTGLGSSTLQFMVYNPNPNALKISRIWQDKAEEFQVNIDGETDINMMKDWELYGGDSLFVFVKVRIDPTKQNAPVLVEDNIHFTVNGKTQTVHLEAYGQDIHLIRSRNHTFVADEYTFTAEKPYLIYDTVAIQNQLTFNPGARLYFHDKAVLIAYGSVSSEGTLDHPVTLQGDRIDRLFDSVPYSYVAGMWGGFYLFDTEDAPAKSYQFDHTEILSANVGLYCLSEKTSDMPHLQLLNSRIHNHAVYGLVLQNMDAEVINCELSNAAAYCVYLAGGTHRFIHSTIASDDFFKFCILSFQTIDKLPKLMSICLIFEHHFYMYKQLINYIIFIRAVPAANFHYIFSFTMLYLSIAFSIRITFSVTQKVNIINDGSKTILLLCTVKFKDPINSVQKYSFSDVPIGFVNQIVVIPTEMSICSMR